MPDFARKLPHVVKLGKHTFRTLDDLRQYILALPRAEQDSLWADAGARVYLAAEGQGDIDDAVGAFRITWSLAVLQSGGKLELPQMPARPWD